MRFDKVSVPPGLIASGKTYTLIFKDAALHVIHTGPAGRNIAAHGAIEQAAVNFVRSRHAKKIASGEARIEHTSLELLIKEKHCVHISKDEITSLQLNSGNPPILKLKSPKGSFKFHFNIYHRDEVLKLIEKLQE